MELPTTLHPATDSWRPLLDPPGDVDARETAIRGPAVWTGSEMIVYTEGLAFNPVTEAWRPVAPPPGIGSSNRDSSMDGQRTSRIGRMGCVRASMRRLRDRLTDECTYDTTFDEWQPIAASPPSPGVHPEGIWTGQEVPFYASAALNTTPIPPPGYTSPRPMASTSGTDPPWSGSKTTLHHWRL